ncbi:hypothetical protein HUG10_08270 [Halorarum halophilum]|uniref:Halobacterial output domain-containing protein n=1 Tax=Halorarum halophilum TaxID=2743090 RepID=A0A7D5GBH8_9EURY|nr:HalOD1 output domain-containing protein [Halobaculum halophilum]QLG27546.1 hypothetical protein HUG10_08270 [Halobaculum halophilum]
MSEDKPYRDVGTLGPESTGHPDPDVTTVRTDWRATGQPSIAVVEAVAEATDRDPLDVASLYDHLDTDALDALVASPEDGTGADVRVSFTYDGVRVLVEGTGEITAFVDSSRGERSDQSLGGVDSG